MSNELGKIKFETKSLASLLPADYNPRTISQRAKEGLSNSIDTFGLLQPIVWNRRTGHIISGHQRYYDLLSKNVLETDVIVVDFDEAKEKAANVAMNNKFIGGDFTEGVMDILSAVESDLGFEQFINAGFDMLELDLLKTFPDTAGLLSDGPVGGKKLPIEENLPDSNVKLVQLYYSADDLVFFNEACMELKKQYMVDNYSDVIILVLKEKFERG